MKPGWPEGLKPAELLANYQFMLEAFLYSTAPADEQERLRKTVGNMVAGKNSAR